MKKLNFLGILSILISILGFVSCSSEDEQLAIDDKYKEEGILVNEWCDLCIESLQRLNKSDIWFERLENNFWYKYFYFDMQIESGDDVRDLVGNAAPKNDYNYFINDKKYFTDYPFLPVTENTNRVIIRGENCEGFELLGVRLNMEANERNLIGNYRNDSIYPLDDLRIGEERLIEQVNSSPDLNLSPDEDWVKVKRIGPKSYAVTFPEIVSKITNPGGLLQGLLQSSTYLELIISARPYAYSSCAHSQLRKFMDKNPFPVMTFAVNFVPLKAGWSSKQAYIEAFKRLYEFSIGSGADPYLAFMTTW